MGVDLDILVFGIDLVVLERASAAIHSFANLSMRKASGRLALATLNNIRGAGFWLKHTTFGYTINTQCLLE